MADSTLTAIRNKVRRLTRSPSLTQLSDALLDDYVNTFVLYDFPEHLRLISCRKQFTFYCNPFQDVYKTDTSWPVDNPLYNFQNKYITMDSPIYVAGFQSLFSQSREQFFGIYPMLRSIQSIGSIGDGVTTAYAGYVLTQGNNVILNPGINNLTPLLQNNVLFDSIDVNGDGLSLIDIPTSNTQGNLVVPGTTAPLGAINYLTGQYSFSFPVAPASGAQINSQTVPYQPSRPQALLWYENEFTLRPVPDQPYAINMEVYARPVELLLTNQSPQLEQWWQYIAYGTSKKVFEDRMDIDSVALIMPEFKKQEALVLRTTLVQQASQRTATIYTDNVAGGFGAGWFYGGGNF